MLSFTFKFEIKCVMFHRFLLLLGSVFTFVTMSRLCSSIVTHILPTFIMKTD